MSIGKNDVYQELNIWLSMCDFQKVAVWICRITRISRIYSNKKLLMNLEAFKTIYPWCGQCLAVQE